MTSLKRILVYLALLPVSFVGFAVAWALLAPSCLYHCWDDAPPFAVSWYPPFIHPWADSVDGVLHDFYRIPEWIVYTVWALFLVGIFTVPAVIVWRFVSGGKSSPNKSLERTPVEQSCFDLSVVSGRRSAHRSPIMRITILLWMFAIYAVAHVAAVEAKLTSLVIVKVVQAQLPEDQSKRDAFLSGLWMDENKSVWRGAKLRNWRSQFKTMKQTMLDRAQEQHLDVVSLRNALDEIFKEAGTRKAYLPISALQAEYQGKSVWVVHVVWEFAGLKKRVGFDHVRSYAFDQATGRKIAFITCL